MGWLQNYRARRTLKRLQVAQEWSDALSWLDDLTPSQQRWEITKNMLLQLIVAGIAGGLAYYLTYPWLYDWVYGLLGTIMD